MFFKRRLRILKLIHRLMLMRCIYQWSIYRLVAIIIVLSAALTCCLSLFYCLLVFHLNNCCFYSSNAIVSLTSTSRRFQYELPFTIHSLLTQVQLPKEIRIYLSPTFLMINQTNLTLNNLKLSIKRIDSSTVIERLFDRLVYLYFEDKDYGPATKFLPILKEFHLPYKNHLLSQTIIICDDDHYYHPHIIDVLVKYSNKYKNTIVGLRGWRIREDLRWGVTTDEEYAYHVIESFRISEPYRVGVVTANSAYAILPSFFDSHIYSDFDKAPNDIRHVDDIWLNGYASKRNITRIVIPSCCSSIGVTRTHELENYLISQGITRSSANDHALKWFNQTWENNLWFQFKGKNHPNYANFLIKIYRQWFNVILRLKFLIYVGFI